MKIDVEWKMEMEKVGKGRKSENRRGGEEMWSPVLPSLERRCCLRPLCWCSSNVGANQKKSEEYCVLEIMRHPLERHEKKKRDYPVNRKIQFQHIIYLEHRTVHLCHSSEQSL